MQNTTRTTTRFVKFQTQPYVLFFNYDVIINNKVKQKYDEKKT